MIDDILGAAITLVIVAIAVFARPTRARCPGGWMLTTGIRPSGVFVCQPPVTGRDDAPGGIDYAVQPPGQIGGRIVCSDGRLPTVRDYRTVACAVGHYAD